MSLKIQNLSGKFFPLLMVCTLLVGCRGASAEGYKFISEDFSKAINSVNAKAFFESPTPVLTDYEKNDSGLSEKVKNNTLVSRIASHYETIGENLCQPIAESYEKMMASGINGKDAYEFDKELVNVVREAGAYVLPLRIYEGEINAKYYNPNWDRNSNEQGGNRKFAESYFKLDPYERLPNSPEFKEQGEIEVTAGVSRNGGSYKKFQDFHLWVTEQNSFELKKLSYEFDFIHGYLFTFAQEPENLNQEIIHYYVDIPYTVIGKKLGDIERLEFKPDALKKVKCYTGSKSDVWLRASSNVKDRFLTDAASPMGEFEPLTIPLNPEYGMTQVPKSNTEKSLVKNDDYSVTENVIADPSLQCWMVAFGFASSENVTCTNTGYAEEFMSLLNKNICVRRDITEAASKLSYPYNVKPSLGRPKYVTGVFTWDTRCNPTQKE